MTSSMKVKDFKDSFKAACRNAGFKDMRIHDLRHVFASKMVVDDINGMPFMSLYITGELLGHKTPNMTQRYAHLDKGTLRKAVEKSFGGHSSLENIKKAEYEKAIEIIRKYEGQGIETS
ncbi:MAG: tyrosine-type recombinase/integrase [bacterium]